MNRLDADRTDEWLTVSWRVIRGTLLVVGVAVFVLGVISIQAPAAERLFPIEAVIVALGSDYTVLAVVGLVAVGLSALVGVASHSHGVTESTPPAVESVASGPSPGHSLDIQTGRLLGSLRRSEPTDHRQRLRTAAITATARAEHCSTAVARQRVATGEWTDDETASWWLADSSHLDAATRDVDRNETPNPRIVSRTVGAIARLTETELPTDNQSVGDTEPAGNNQSEPSRRATQ